MSTIPPEGAPSIPPRFRTVTYFAGLAVGGATILAIGLTAAVAPGSVGTVLAVCGAVTSATSFVLGGLGVAFRPTAGQPSGRITGNVWGDGTPVIVAEGGPSDLAPEVADLAPEVR